MHLHLPAESTTRIELDIDKAYLWYTDYPPDALRGFDVPSGVLLSNASGMSKRIYTTTTLLDMPTPDFSMPYNVIIMTCESASEHALARRGRLKRRQQVP